MYWLGLSVIGVDSLANSIVTDGSWLAPRSQSHSHVPLGVCSEHTPSWAAAAVSATHEALSDTPMSDVPVSGDAAHDRQRVVGPTEPAPRQTWSTPAPETVKRRSAMAQPLPGRSLGSCAVRCLSSGAHLATGSADEEPKH